MRGICLLLINSDMSNLGTVYSKQKNKKKKTNNKIIHVLKRNGMRLSSGLKHQRLIFLYHICMQISFGSRLRQRHRLATNSVNWLRPTMLVVDDRSAGHSVSGRGWSTSLAQQPHVNNVLLEQYFIYKQLAL